jgi:starch synthase (maltosyl-transferring)
MPVRKRTSESSPAKAPAALPSVVIENVTPQIDAGRHAVKRIIGDTCHVGADIYKDGHDLLAARLLVRRPRTRQWQYSPLTYDYHSDRWSGEFAVDELGRWVFMLEAWPDYFATWRSDLEKWVGAGQDVTLELREGAILIREAAERAAANTKTRLEQTAALLENSARQLDERVAAALDGELRQIMASHFDPSLITRYGRTLPVWVDRERARFGAWYEMFPRSQGSEPGKHGSFREAELQLPRLADLGFDVVYLPPIHPVGSTHRKGRNNALVAGPDDPGSPWAIGNAAGGHSAVEPQLGTLDDFDHFVERADELGLDVALDYALQCSPDHPWVSEHPEWFDIRPDGSIRYAENPPKRYEDIYPLDFWCDNWRALWEACRDVLSFWCEHGVRVFRVDNPHTKPFAFWEWVIQEIQSEHPDVIFLAEAFTRPNRMKGLAKIGFTQSYTYFTWRNTPKELRDYLIELTQTEMAEYFRPNFFANTPDILHEYLQTGGRAAFRVRLLLAATLSPTYGIYSGFELCENEPREPGSEEYLNSEKYEIKFRHWDAAGNINEDIEKINRARRENPALQYLNNITFLRCDNDRLLCYRKSAPPNELIVIANLDPDRAHESTVHVPLHELGIAENQPYQLKDLLTGERFTWKGIANYVFLDPKLSVGHVLRLLHPDTETNRK